MSEPSGFHLHEVSVGCQGLNCPFPCSTTEGELRGHWPLPDTDGLEKIQESTRSQPWKPPKIKPNHDHDKTPHFGFSNAPISRPGFPCESSGSSGWWVARPGLHLICPVSRGPEPGPCWPLPGVQLVPTCLYLACFV